MGFDFLKWVKLLPDTRNVLGPLNRTLSPVPNARCLWLCKYMAMQFRIHRTFPVTGVCISQAIRDTQRTGMGSPVQWRHGQGRQIAPDQDKMVYTNDDELLWGWLVLGGQTKLTNIWLISVNKTCLSAYKTSIEIHFSNLIAPGRTPISTQSLAW